MPSALTWAYAGVIPLSLALALILVVAGPRRWTNWTLGLTLALNGANWGTFSLLEFLPDTPFVQLNGSLWWVVLSLALLPLYLLFVGSAIPSPIARLARGPLARGLLLVAAVACAPAVLLAPHAWLDLQSLEGTPLFARVFVTGSLLVFGFSLVAALDAWRRAAPGSALRHRAARYALLFGTYDACWLIDVVLPPSLSEPFEDGFFLWVFYAFLVTIAIGLLREQLVGIDLQLKWTVRRGTLVAIFLAAFASVAAILEQWLQSYNLLVGGLAAGLLLFALRPLERAADRLADRAMPRVQDNAEYRTVRKREVYGAAVESALEDGEVTEKERSMLATLADQLGLGAKEALEVEREARGARSPRMKPSAQG